MSFNSSSNLDLTLEKNDMDIEIHNQRLLYILDKTISRVKLVPIFIFLATNSTSPLQDYLTDEAKQDIIKIKNRYEKQDIQDLEDAHEVIKEEAAWQAEAKSKQTDQDLLKILLYIEDHKKLKKALDSNVIKQPPQVELFIKCLHELRNSVEVYQNESVAQENAREKHLRRCHLRNDKTKKEISQLEQELIDKKSELNASIIGKNLVVNRYQSKIERIQKLSREAIDRRVIEMEAAIKADQESSSRIQEALKEELEEKYNNLLKEHVASQRTLRAQRLKVENQLAAFMAKFDQDMGEKQAEEEQLQAQYETQKKKYEEIQKQLDEQEEEYDELMQEKAAYEQELLEQKLFIFILNRSARRIQRAFRAYKLRKLTKKSKKGKKGKGKKK